MTLVGLKVVIQEFNSRYLIDQVILGRRLDRLAAVILLLIGIALASKALTLVQRFYFARFEQGVILDIQQNMLSPH